MKKFVLILILIFGSFIFISGKVYATENKIAAKLCYNLKKISTEKQIPQKKIILVLESFISKFKEKQNYQAVEILQDTKTCFMQGETESFGGDTLNKILDSLRYADENICNTTLKQLVQNLPKKTFYVSSENEVREVLKQAKTRQDKNLYYEIVFKKGVYNLSNGFWLDTPNLIFRGETGNPDDVKLFGKGMNGNVSHVFWVATDNILIGDMTIGKVKNHPIQVHGEKNADNLLFHNLKIIDAGEQMIKGSFDKNNPQNFSKNGVIECSEFYYSAGIGPQYYIGGIDIHHGKHWLVQYNYFNGIRSPENRLAEHAIHFWSNSSDVIVKKNRIENCDRGIGFGLGDSGFSSGKILENIILHDKTRGDVGIGLENAHDVYIRGNTINFENDYPNAIEYRFPGTYNVIIEDNDVNKSIVSRDGGKAIFK